MEEHGISFDKSVSEFDEFFQKAKNLKERIDEEIEAINDNHKKITDEITNYFEEEHFKLNEKEKQLKYELDLKVTEIKDELEQYFRETTKILLSCERLSKAIKNYSKQNNNNEMKDLFYISKINEISIESKSLFKKPIKNLDIYFINKSIYYKEYYFSGIPIPKDIKAEIKDNKLLISWDLRTKNFDIKNVKYLLKLKYENEYTDYEASKTNILIDEYKINIDYEVKVRALINGLYGGWSDLMKFKIQKKNQNNFLFGDNFNGGGLFGNNSNQGGSLFANTNSIFNKNDSKGAGLFGNNNATGGLFGRSIFNNNDSKVPGLFGNNNATGDYLVITINE